MSQKLENLLNLALDAAQGERERSEELDVGYDKELLQYGILIRDCANYRGLETGWYRIAVKQRHENEQLLKALKEIIERNRQEADIDGKTDHDTGNDVECREECAGRRSLPHLEGGRL